MSGSISIRVLPTCSYRLPRFEAGDATLLREARTEGVDAASHSDADLIGKMMGDLENLPEPTNAEVEEVLRLGREYPLSDGEARRLLKIVVKQLNKRLSGSRTIADADIDEMIRQRGQAGG